MNHRILIIIVLILSLLMINSTPSKTLQDTKFEGVNLSKTDYQFEDGEQDYHFNIIYSPFLPAGGIYHMVDNITGKEAIVQIGLAQVNKSPYTLYLPDHLFKFFASSYDKEVDKIHFQLKFLGWNRKGEESSHLDVLSLMVQPEDSLNEIENNGLENYYIQIGAYSYYQNSYPHIIKSLPYLKIIPHFYLIEIEKKDADSVYRILAGPYTLSTARSIVKRINEETKNVMYIHSGEDILKKYDKK